MKIEKRFWIPGLLALVCGVCIGLLLNVPDRARETAAAFSYGAVDLPETSAGAPTPGPSVQPTPTEPVNVFMITAVETPGRETPLPEETPEPAAADSVQAEFLIRVLGTPESLKAAPKILIYHTHTYEAYRKQENLQYEETEQWRTADPRYNMIRVGEELAALLRGLGCRVVHDQTAFEPPELSTAYARSLAMLEQRKAVGESYDLYIDLHRDAYMADQGVANTVMAGGSQLARMLLLVGRGDGQTTEGFSQRPQWEKNKQIAQSITDRLNDQAAGLCKEVRLKSGRFNQHIDVGCLLVEAGNNQNTLEEVLLAMPYLADAILGALDETGE